MEVNVDWNNRRMEIDGSQHCVDCGHIFVKGDACQPYKHWAVDLYMFRCLPCAESWQPIEDNLNLFTGNGRSAVKNSPNKRTVKQQSAFRL